jgi:hypothetical protein
MMSEECVVRYNRKPLKVEDDPIRGRFNIEGIWYSYELLQGLARTLPLEEPFIITQRGDGVITLERFLYGELSAGKPVGGESGTEE